MVENARNRTRRAEIEEILERKPGTREVDEEEDRYTVVGTASRRTFVDWVTPIENHFVCHRNDVPDADAETWRVGVTGIGDEDRLSIDTIRESYPTVATAHTMECAGNNRGHHEPKTGSVQWGFGALATAVWTGTPVQECSRTADSTCTTTRIGGSLSSGATRPPTAECTPNPSH